MDLQHAEERDPEGLRYFQGKKKDLWREMTPVQRNSKTKTRPTIRDSVFLGHSYVRKGSALTFPVQASLMEAQDLKRNPESCKW